MYIFMRQTKIRVIYIKYYLESREIWKIIHTHYKQEWPQN